MFKVCTTAIVLGLTIGMVASVQQVVGDLLHELDATASMGMPVSVISPTTPHAMPGNPNQAARLVQVAQALSIPRERLLSLAQDAASEGDGNTCIEIMIAAWGPAWTERVLREANFASTR